MGYSGDQVADLEATIHTVPCDVVIFGALIDLRRMLNLRCPAVRIRYDMEESGQPTLADAFDPLKKKPILAS